MYPASAYDGDGMARVADIITHYVFTCAARRVARVASAEGTPVYLYRFSYAIHWIEELLGLGDYHSSELAFVWDNQWPPLVHAFNDDDATIADAFGNYWSSMAYTGNPNDITSPLPWPQYNASTDLNLEIALPFAVNAGLEEEMVRVTPVSLFFWYLLPHTLLYSLSCVCSAINGMTLRCNSPSMDSHCEPATS